MRILLLLWCCMPFVLQSQIYWTNASFEGEPQDATVPVGWLPCERGTTPDILPGVWGVTEEASDGKTYVGLITRPDGSHESITQRLKQPLNKKECFAFSLDLARSDTYAGYGGPLKIRIWGSVQKCGKDQLLYESDFIESTEWETHLIDFSTKITVNYIIIEAFYKTGRSSYSGNILVDNISPIKKCIKV